MILIYQVFKFWIVSIKALIKKRKKCIEGCFAYFQIIKDCDATGECHQFFDAVGNWK